MTIIVVTPEHGDRSFDADEWETLAGELGDEGNLWIGKDEVGVAEFAKGAWLFVYEVKDPQPEVKPRQWGYLATVPHDVEVRSSGGCYWKYWQPGETDESGRVVTSDGAWLWSSEHARKNGYKYDRTGPFTEVLDA